eukprot:3722083-Pleurochrysis_carterae.AAC.1
MGVGGRQGESESASESASKDANAARTFGSATGKICLTMEGAARGAGDVGGRIWPHSTTSVAPESKRTLKNSPLTSTTSASNHAVAVAPAA